MVYDWIESDVSLGHVVTFGMLITVKILTPGLPETVYWDKNLKFCCWPGYQRHTLLYANFRKILKLFCFETSLVRNRRV